MDGLTAPDRAPVVRFGPDRRLTALVGAAAVVAVVSTILTDDAQGQLLFGLAAAVLVLYTIGDLVFWPRLAADTVGIRIRTPLARVDLPWSAVEDVRADVRSRYGVRSSTLEVDAGETLVVFSRRALGADPDTVQGLVRAMDPRRRGA